MDFPGGSDGKASVYNVGDLGLSPGLGRSSGEGNGHSSTLVWKVPWTEDHAVTKRQIGLSDFTHSLIHSANKKP